VLERRGRRQGGMVGFEKGREHYSRACANSQGTRRVQRKHGIIRVLAQITPQTAHFAQITLARRGRGASRESRACVAGSRKQRRKGSEPQAARFTSPSNFWTRGVCVWRPLSSLRSLSSAFVRSAVHIAI